MKRLLPRRLLSCLGILIKVRCIFYALDNVEEADASHLFDSIDQHFQNSDVLTYDHLIGLWLQRHDGRKEFRNVTITIKAARIDCPSL